MARYRFVNVICPWCGSKDTAQFDKLGGRCEDCLRGFVPYGTPELGELIEGPAPGFLRTLEKIFETSPIKVQEGIIAFVPALGHKDREVPSVCPECAEPLVSIMAKLALSCIWADGEWKGFVYSLEFTCGQCYSPLDAEKVPTTNLAPSLADFILENI